MKNTKKDLGGLKEGSNEKAEKEKNLRKLETKLEKTNLERYLYQLRRDRKMKKSKEDIEAVDKLTRETEEKLKKINSKRMKKS